MARSNKCGLARDQQGPVFLMNVTSVAEAHTILEKLPLGQAKLFMESELVELTLLTPFTCFSPKAGRTRR